VFQLVGQYIPTWVEYFIVLGLVAFGAMLVTVGIRYLGFGELRLKIMDGHGHEAQKAAQA